MARIRVLPDGLVNRIAAGEVVERPASVVKELVENAIDAGASRVVVELVAGGRQLVRVEDDGCGMDGDDALLALERHATSKISDAGDLERLSTLGFRGEALPSIAAVSRFRLTTCADPADGGVRVTVDGGRVVDVSPVARPRGTTVEVRDLFFSTPARRKFLRTPDTELRHAQETILAAALARPDIAFTLRHGSRTLLEAPPAADAAERANERFGGEGVTVRRFEESGGGGRVWGVIAGVDGGRRGRPSLVLLVNGRPVRDRLLSGAVLRALRDAGPGLGGVRVIAALEVDPSTVDVNVHPAKAEVRFQSSGAVFALVERAVRKGVDASRGHVPVARLDEEGADGVSEPAGTAYRPTPAAPRGLFTHPVYHETGNTLPEERRRPSAASSARRERGPGPRTGPPDTPYGRLIGQYRDSFLLLEDEWGLVIVDQHVAHERVLYERIRRRLAGETAPSQGLLEPVLLEVGEALAGALDRVEGLLGRVGISADLFGPDTVRISSLPPELDAAAAGELVEELLERATDLDDVPEWATERLSDELAASLSCRAAIKVNHQLNEVEQRALLADLSTADNPNRCPHGRPIVLRLSQEEMERRLGRR